MTTNPSPTEQLTRTLADGTQIPRLGLGVWQVADGDDCVNAVRWALELGYRHIDTAQAYGNEKSVGQALRDSGLPREDVFITTKFFPRQTDATAALEQSLERLGLDYVDLYIVHWPEGGPTWAWEGLVRAQAKGATRSIGVSNFSAQELDGLLAVTTTKPVVNQVQFSPFEYRQELLAACSRHDVAVEAYSPLGTGRHLSNPVVDEVAKGLGRTPAQVLLRWCLQRDTIVLPKSTHHDRIAENAKVFDFELSTEAMSRLDALDGTGRTDTAREDAWWR